MIRRSLSSCLLLGSMIFGLGCAGDSTPATSDDPDVVAAFRGGVIRRAEFDEFRNIRQEEDPQVAEGESADWREINIKELVLRKVLAAQAPPDTTDPQLRIVVSQAESSVLRTVLPLELDWDKLHVTTAEIREQYDTHPEQYKDPEKLRLQHIYMRAEVDVMSPAEREKVHQRLEEIRREIISGAEFGEMARKYSQSSTAPAGGWMTLKADGSTFAAFVEAVWDLAPQEISPVIDTPTGFQLAKAADRIAPIDRKFEDVVEFASRRTLQEKLDAARAAFVQEASPRLGLKKHYDRLDDNMIADDEALIEMGEERYTFGNLVSALPTYTLSQLYNGYFRRVYKFLDKVALNRLLVKEAKLRGLHEREDAAKQIAIGVREARYGFMLHKRLLELADEVPEAKIEEFFRQNEKRYQTLRTYDLDVILLKPKPDEVLWQTLKRGERLVEQLRAGADFAELARAHSSHYSASNGGRFEYITSHGIARLVQPRAGFRNQFPTVPDGTILDAQVAECYDPDLLRYFDTGVIIVRLVKSYPPKQAIFEEIKDMVRENYLRRNYQALEEQLRQEIFDSIDLRIYYDHLPAI